MIRLSLLTGPAQPVELDGIPGVTVTLRRLNTADFALCHARAAAIIADRESLVTFIARHELARTSRQMKRLFSEAPLQAGLGALLGAIECGLAAIEAWTGVVLEDGRLAPLAADYHQVAGLVEPPEPQALAARMAMESFMLDSRIERAVCRKIDEAARILAIEGKGSGLSEHGSPAAPPTIAEGPPGAESVQD